jgi:hypothetical protein
MLVEFACFGAGCVAGGYFVFRGTRAAYTERTTEAPVDRARKGRTSGNDGGGSYFIHAKDNPAAIRRSKELQRRLVNDDARRGAIGDGAH